MYVESHNELRHPADDLWLEVGRDLLQNLLAHAFEDVFGGLPAALERGRGPAAAVIIRLDRLLLVGAHEGACLFVPLEDKLLADVGSHDDQTVREVHADAPRVRQVTLVEQLQTQPTATANNKCDKASESLFRTVS